MYSMLILDDEKIVLQGIQKLCQKEDFGFVIKGAFVDSLKALDALPGLRPHLIITDVRMPQMDGLEFARRAKEILPESEIVILSGYRDFSYAQTAMQIGVSDYLLKPIVETDLNTAIQRAVESLCPGFTPADARKEETNLDSDTVTTIIHDYIDNHYSSNIKISQFADKYFFSKEYLTRQFKARYHCGIYEYVLQVRMERARELLLNPEIKIQEIAQRVGYADNNYFSKAFRTYYGISPTAFRQENGL